jgi:hypothetical protein
MGREESKEAGMVLFFLRGGIVGLVGVFQRRWNGRAGWNGPTPLLGMIVTRDKVSGTAHCAIREGVGRVMSETWPDQQGDMRMIGYGGGEGCPYRLGGRCSELSNPVHHRL